MSVQLAGSAAASWQRLAICRRPPPPALTAPARPGCGGTPCTRAPTTQCCAAAAAPLQLAPPGGAGWAGSAAAPRTPQAGASNTAARNAGPGRGSPARAQRRPALARLRRGAGGREGWLVTSRRATPSLPARQPPHPPPSRCLPRPAAQPTCVALPHAQHQAQQPLCGARHLPLWHLQLPHVGAVLRGRGSGLQGAPSAVLMQAARRRQSDSAGSCCRACSRW